MTKKLTALAISCLTISTCFGQTKPKQFQYMPGVNKKMLTGTITKIFYTTRWKTEFMWLSFGQGDTIIHVWPKDNLNMVVGRKVSLTGIKTFNQSLGPVIPEKGIIAKAE